MVKVPYTTPTPFVSRLYTHTHTYTQTRWTKDKRTSRREWRTSQRRPEITVGNHADGTPPFSKAGIERNRYLYRAPRRITFRPDEPVHTHTRTHVINCGSNERYAKYVYDKLRIRFFRFLFFTKYEPFFCHRQQIHARIRNRT